MSKSGTLISLDEYLATAYEPDCDYIDGSLEERNVGEWAHSLLQSRIAAYFMLRYRVSGYTALTELRIRVNPDKVRIPDLCVFLNDPKQRVPSTPPFLCIEILSPEDRMSRLEARIADYLSMGVPWVWILDPETRQAYVATADEGLREVKSGVLRTTAPLVEMPLADVLGEL
jgi:Uma2 family endonuclease